MENNQEKDSNTKRLIIIALLLALLACCFGFAALSSTVDIDEGKKEASFAVYKGGVLSISPIKPENGKVYPTSKGGAKADPATLTENGIININVHFTKPGQSATYSFFGINPTKNTSFLNSIYFADKQCTAKGGSTESFVQSACDDIVMIVTVKDETFTQTVDEVDFHPLKPESNEPITVTIKYKDSGNIPDGSFNVDFGTSTITYSDLD